MLNLPSIFEKDLYPVFTREYLSITSVFHKKKLTRKFRLKLESDLLIKKAYISLFSTAFAESCPTRWNLEGTLPPSISAAGCKRRKAQV